MPSKLRLSVALATYNGQRYLREQLESYSRQSRRPDELVVCDDDSSDDTIPIAQAFAKEAPFDVRIEVNAVRLGCARNFAKAISACSGDIIFLSDQDDVWMPSKLARLEQVFERDSTAVMAFGDTALTDQCLRPLGYTGFESLGLRGRGLEQIRAGRALEVLLRFNVVTGAAMAFRAELRPAVLPIGAGWVHDEWIAAVAAASGQIVVVDQPLVFYRQHERQQIGLRKLGLLGTVQKAWRMGEPYMRSAHDRAEALCERLLAQDRPLARANYRESLESKREHTRRRLDMRRGPWRLPLVALALARGDYARFDRGVSSALQDLFMY